MGGTEGDDFWDLLVGGREMYRVSLPGDNPDFAPRLFCISNATGAMRLEEIFDFVQSDLKSEDVMMLHTSSTIFVWIGKQCTKDEQIAGMETSTKYIYAGKAPEGTPVAVVKEGREPWFFTSHFLNWQPAAASSEVDDASDSGDVQLVQVAPLQVDDASDSGDVQLLLVGPLQVDDASDSGDV